MEMEAENPLPGRGSGWVYSESNRQFFFNNPKAIRYIIGMIYIGESSFTLFSITRNTLSISFTTS